MGTHPIFESDFDCLTENRITHLHSLHQQTNRLKTPKNKMSENGETVDNSALDAIQRRLLELSELFPLTFWKNLDRLNVQEQRTPRWSFLINSNGIQCNIYWENKTEQEKLEEDALLGGEALKRAEKWLQDAQNAGGDENLSQVKFVHCSWC